MRKEGKKEGIVSIISLFNNTFGVEKNAKRMRKEGRKNRFTFK